MAKSKSTSAPRPRGRPKSVSAPAPRPRGRPKATTPTAKKSLQDFKAAHDKSFIIPNKIKEGLAKLGKDGWEYEPDFTRLCGISSNDMSKYRDEFSDYIVLAGRTRDSARDRRVWAGSVALANKMREMVDQ